MARRAFNINLNETKSKFFDRNIFRAVDRAAVRQLSKFGAFVRTGARTSIRKNKNISQPGQPPKSHTGLLRNYIFFSYDPANRSVVIGPVDLGRVGQANEALEYGGQSTIHAGRFSGGKKKQRTKRVYIRKRPYMQPAFDREKTNPKLNALWANSVTAAG